MKTLVIDGFEINEEYVERLLLELKNDRVKTIADLERYLKGFKYMNDTGRKCHLLISPQPKKESFALPYEE